MGTSTISMASVNSFLYVYQAGYSPWPQNFPEGFSSPEMGEMTLWTQWPGVSWAKFFLKLNLLEVDPATDDTYNVYTYMYIYIVYYYYCYLVIFMYLFIIVII
jgi:hypothetical protein